MKAFMLPAWNIVMRDYRVRFRRTLLGVVWFLLPLFALVGMALFVGKDIGLYANGEQSRYLVQLLSGLIFWQLLADTWLEPMRFGRRTNMVLRAVVFDQRALLAAGALSALVALVVKAPVLIAALVWFKVVPDHTALLLPLGIASLLAVGVAMACFTLPISLALLDIRYGAPFVQYIFLLITPVFYPMPATGSLTQINQLNPFTYLVPPVRDALIGQPVDTTVFFVSSLVAALFLGVGLAYFQAKMRLAIAYIGR